MFVLLLSLARRLYHSKTFCTFGNLEDTFQNAKIKTKERKEKFEAEGSYDKATVKK